MRLSELAGLGRQDVDLKRREALVTGKGGKQRIVRFGHDSALALDRYLRERARHKMSGRAALWLGIRNRGPMTPSGIYQMTCRRGAQAGVEVHPHKFGHHFSHTWLDNGGAPDGWQVGHRLGQDIADCCSQRGGSSWPDRLEPCRRNPATGCIRGCRILHADPQAARRAGGRDACRLGFVYLADAQHPMPTSPWRAFWRAARRQTCMATCQAQKGRTSPMPDGMPSRWRALTASSHQREPGWWMLPYGASSSTSCS